MVFDEELLLDPLDLLQLSISFFSLVTHGGQAVEPWASSAAAGSGSGFFAASRS